jgi:hypothetical protein
MHNGRRKIFDFIPTRQQACSRNYGKSVGRARLDERRDVRSLFTAISFPYEKLSSSPAGCFGGRTRQEHFSCG